MEPAADPPPPMTMPEALSHRVQRIAVAVMLAALPWTIQPGRTQPDSKTDLLLDPWGYLERATHAWSAHGGPGELQNQAYGYLFPMGPFFGLGHSLGVPDWATQRAWWGLLLVVAFLGMERLLRTWNVAAPGATIVAAAMYALSPRVLTLLSEHSVEAWPMAMSPWLVLNAVRLAQARDAPRSLVVAAAHTALLTFCIGGVNAVATGAALVAPFLWLLTMPRGHRRGRVVVAWVSGVLVGTAWWLIPLLVLGRYAYPFLDYIETASMTTATTGVANVLRGTPHWIAYLLDAESHPEWQSGWVLSQDSRAIVATAAVAAIGVAGLFLLPRGSHLKRYAVGSVLLGVVAMSIGYGGPWGSPVSDSVRTLLDGPLAPLRNVHKLDPLIRIGLLTGFAVALQGLLDRSRQWRRAGPWIGPAVALLLVGATLPLALGRVGDSWSYEAVPQAWHEAAAAVDADAAERGGSTLLLPFSRFPDYEWGRPNDEPLQGLARSRLVLRSAAPLYSPQVVRLLDRVDELAATGVAQPGLAGTLRRLGVARVVVRHDLAPVAGAADPELVVRTLTASPGLRLRAGFGDPDQVDLFEVGGSQAGAQSYAVAGAVSVVGAPESMPDLITSGLLHPDQAMLTTAPAQGTTGHGAVATDTPVLRLYNPALPRALQYGDPLPAADARLSRPDLPVSPTLPPVVRTWRGLSSVDASSSAADPYAKGYRGAQWGVAAMFDGDRGTGWVAGDERPEQELTLDFGHPVATAISLSPLVASDTSAPTEVRAWGDGRTVEVTTDAEGTFHLDLTDSAVTTVRIGLDGDGVSPVGVSELAVAGVDVQPELTLTGAVSGGLVVRRRTEERSIVRSWTTDGPRSTAASVWLRPVASPALDRLLDGDWLVRGSAADPDDPSSRPGAAVDGDPQTSWRPATDDRTSTLEIRFPEEVTVRGVRVGPSDAAVTGVSVQVGRRSRLLGPEGGAIDGLRGRSLRITLVHPESSLLTTWPEITLLGPPHRPTTPTRLACGQAGSLLVDGQRLPLALTTTHGSLVRRALVRARVCGPSAIRLAGGSHGLSVRTPGWMRAELVRLDPTGESPVGSETARGRPIDRVTVDDRSAHLVLGAGQDSIVALDQGANAGWVAEQDGRRLSSVVVDGWRQGFVVPGGAATEVVVTFAPSATYRAGLLAGAALVLLALVVALVGRRRVSPRDADWLVGRPATLPVLLGPLASVGLGFVLAGPIGVAVGAVAALVAVLVGARWRMLLAATAVAASGVAMALLGSWGHYSAGARAGQALAVLGVALLTCELAAARDGGSSRPAVAPGTGERPPPTAPSPAAPG